ncbi:NAD(P)-dependent oxidoreductase [Gordonia sp. NPDC003376]
MKITILGATGNVGSATLREAVAAGHQVVAYVRRPDAVEALPGVTVIAGDLDDSSALTEAIRGADAVIAAVTGPTKDSTFTQRTLPVIVAATQEAGVARLVQVSAFGVGDTADKASWFARLIYRTVLGKFFADKAAAEHVLTDSTLDWVMVYPVNLKKADAVKDWAAVPLESVARVPGLPTLPFANVATTLVELAGSAHLDARRILITTASGWKGN